MGYTDMNVGRIHLKLTDNKRALQVHPYHRDLSDVFLLTTWEVDTLIRALQQMRQQMVGLGDVPPPTKRTLRKPLKKSLKKPLKKKVTKKGPGGFYLGKK